MSVHKVAGHVFISYVREDSDRVDQLQRTLLAAGVPVWRDTADLWPGEDWRARIRAAITSNALVFLACFSGSSLARNRSYMNEELVLAIEQLRQRTPERPWLIPVRFDDCEIPDRDIGAGRTLTSIQRVDLFGDSYDDGAHRLVSAILQVLGQNPDSPQTEDDGFDELVLIAGLSSRQVTLLRASAKYLRQAGIRFSEDQMQQALRSNATLWAWFRADR